MDLTMESLLQRDQSFGLGDSRDMLNPIVELLHKMLIVVCMDLNKHRIRACGEIALHHFGDLRQFGGGFAIEGTLLESHTDISASVIS